MLFCLSPDLCWAATGKFLLSGSNLRCPHLLWLHEWWCICCLQVSEFRHFQKCIAVSEVEQDKDNFTRKRPPNLLFLKGHAGWKSSSKYQLHFLFCPVEGTAPLLTASLTLGMWHFFNRMSTESSNSSFISGDKICCFSKGDKRKSKVKRHQKSPPHLYPYCFLWCKSPFCFNNIRLKPNQVNMNARCVVILRNKIARCLPGKWAYSGGAEELQFWTANCSKTIGKCREQRRGACFYRRKEGAERGGFDWKAIGREWECRVVVASHQLGYCRARRKMSFLLLRWWKSIFLLSSPFRASHLRFKWGFLYSCSSVCVCACVCVLGWIG